MSFVPLHGGSHHGQGGQHGIVLAVRSVRRGLERRPQTRSRPARRRTPLGALVPVRTDSRPSWPKPVPVHTSRHWDRKGCQAPGVRRVREGRRPVGPPAHLPDLQLHPLLRQFTQSTRDGARTRHGASGDCLGGAGGALAVLLSGRRVRRLLTRLAAPPQVRSGRAMSGTLASGGGQFALRWAYRGSSVAAIERKLPASVFR